jgi:hypothetical protein
MFNARLKGYIFLILGSLAIFVFALPLLVPVVAAVFGLWLINYGLRLLGRGGLFFVAQRAFFNYHSR